MNGEYLLSEPESPAPIGQTIRRMIGKAPIKLARFAHAYVTTSGLHSSLATLDRAPSFERASKLWLIGVHHGISEPGAIDRLSATPNTKVRLVVPSGRLNRAALQDRRKLHAKISQIGLANREIVMIGSANLTYQALGAHCTNYETSIGLIFNPKAGAIRNAPVFVRWYNRLWQSSLAVTPKLLDSYANIRRRFVDENPVIATELDEPPTEHIGDYENMWIEAGAMSGQDRNQVEFGPRLAEFFGDLAHGSRRIKVRYGGHFAPPRPLSFKTTQWGTKIWRLSLVTSRQGGPQYPSRIIKFTRTKEEDGFFDLDVEDAASNTAARWKATSHRCGVVAETGTTGRGRQYGVY